MSTIRINGNTGVNLIGSEEKKGNILFNDNNTNYIEELSRNAVEEYNNYEIIYFKVDWKKSKTNFYGEVKQIKFVDEIGTKLKGKIHISQEDIEIDNSIYDKKNKATFSVYDQALNEAGISLKRGDYFIYGIRFYRIYDYTIKDSAGVGIANAKKIRTDIFAYEASDEKLNNDIFNNIINKIKNETIK